jgi:hypothetical protein
MKAGLLKTIASDFRPFFPSEWVLQKNVFRRKQSDWVHEIGFNASRFADEYNPVSSVFYTNMQLDPPSLCGQLLLATRHPVQRWISLAEHKQKLASIFEAMTQQFRPNIAAPLDEQVIQNLLVQHIDYWPHAYALCLLSVHKGRYDQAAKYFDSFNHSVAKMNYPWVAERRKELEQALIHAGK